MLKRRYLDYPVEALKETMLRKTGANFSGTGKCEFSVWAPFKEKVQLEFESPDFPVTDLEKDAFGYWHKNIDGIEPGMKYRFILDEELTRPDPASRAQPDGVHGWSQVRAENDHVWNDSEWENIPLHKMIIYELHTGTFTPEGTFEAVTTKLDHLLELGINAIEIMPVAQFSGTRNWGYDGVYHYAPQESYGGAEGLKALVDVCHQKGIAVILDVVYNHLGPEGNYLADFGPYFTDKYATPWGTALNFDDAYSDHVKGHFLRNALMWLDEFHIDGLRLDAIHAILDNSANHFLKELRQNVDELQRRNRRTYYLIAESDMNDVKVISPYSSGGYGLDAQWADDFHHAVHTVVTGEKTGYYADYGELSHLAKAFRQAFVYDGIYSAFRKRSIGNDPKGHALCKFVVCIQNHDQVGNRMLGERLSALVSFEMLKLSACVYLMSPFVPMLFMGEEYGEQHPFQYFVSHGDPDLVEAVREGRKKEFEYFGWQEQVPDPQAEETFMRSKLQWNYEDNAEMKAMFTFYKHLIALRKEGAFAGFSTKKIDTEMHEKEKVLIIRSQDIPSGPAALLAIINFNDKDQSVHVPASHEKWQKLMASADEQWKGPGTSADVIEKGTDIEVRAESILLYKAKT